MTRSQFVNWLKYFGKVFGKAVIGTPPPDTSQNYSNCGETVKQYLPVRNPIFQGKTVEKRDLAALSILAERANTDSKEYGNAWGKNALRFVDRSLQDP